MWRSATRSLPRLSVPLFVAAVGCRAPAGDGGARLSAPRSEQGSAAPPTVALGAPEASHLVDGAASPRPLEVLVASLPMVATGGGGIGRAEDDLAKEIQAHGAAAIPLLLPILRGEDARARALAGYVLRDIDGLNESHLDALIAARRAGEGWIPPAIARVGTPRAIQFLLDDLTLRPEPQTQVTYALALAGEASVDPIVRLYRSGNSISRELGGALCEVLAELGPKAAGAVAPLAELAGNTHLPLSRRTRAIEAIGCIGEGGRVVAPELQRIGAALPRASRNAVDDALVSIGAPEAIPTLLSRVRTGSPRAAVVALRDLARLGSGAGVAIPEIVGFLTAGDWEVRVAAARALGFAGDGAAIGPLIAVLTSTNDWRLPYVAADALARLRAKDGLPALVELAARHWYPPVRQSAADAAAAIRGSRDLPRPADRSRFGREFFRYEFLPSTLPHSALTISRSAGPNELSPEDLRRHPYAYDAPTGEGDRSTRRTQIANVGLALDGGYLLGASRGEWGGEMVFVDGTGRQRVVLDENTVGIHRVGERVLAVVGLAHMGLDAGNLYLVRTDGRHPTAERWKVLPGAPRRSAVLPDGTLLVSCTGGDVIVRGDGSMAMYDGLREPPPDVDSGAQPPAPPGIDTIQK